MFLNNRDMMVVTSVFITKGGMPILEVSHEGDGEGGSLWQFHCGNGNYDMGNMQLVRLDTILDIDPTIEQLSNLGIGEMAYRYTERSPWILMEIIK